MTRRNIVELYSRAILFVIGIYSTIRLKIEYPDSQNWVAGAILDGFLGVAILYDIVIMHQVI